MKALLSALAAPWSLSALLLERFASNRLRSDLESCIELTNRLGESLPDAFIDAVILAEDHRNNLHPGIDVIAMIRASWVRIRLGQVQGASTIEQQFVRVVTKRHERTARRKIREQMLALMLVRRTTKRRIASTYLATAFYGSGSIGLSGLRDEFGESLDKVPFAQALRYVARLKYPRPRRPSKEWRAKMAARIDALHGLGAGTANKSLQRTFDPRAILQPQNGPRLKRR